MSELALGDVRRGSLANRLEEFDTQGRCVSCGADEAHRHRGECPITQVAQLEADRDETARVLVELAGAVAGVVTLVQVSQSLWERVDVVTKRAKELEGS